MCDFFRFKPEMSVFKLMVLVFCALGNHGVSCQFTTGFLHWPVYSRYQTDVCFSGKYLPAAKHFVVLL